MASKLRHGRSNSYFSKEYMELDKQMRKVKVDLNKVSRGCKEFQIEIEGQKYHVIALNELNAIRKAKKLHKENKDASVQAFRVD